MSPFFEGRLPLPLTRGAGGGPERRTEIVTLGSGREQRNAVWAHGRRRYNIGGAIATLDELNAVIAFFDARRGRLQGFRYHDAADGKSCAPSATPAPLDQPLGVGDGARVAFPLQRAYGDYLRPILKPVAGSVRVALDGVELMPAAFAVDTTTGLVTLAAAPATGKPVSAGFLFDTPVRFDADRLDATLEAPGAARTLSIPLIEIVL